ncbi:hypothetical protein PtrM4_137060 [Pyrenophora tritici-repentis]|uniref:Uncharacterized protein n=1 Tax=Pyrenophora tritici-repentis TaxID=45151 RepID=A0A834VKJ1_9PLEO|nr:hypothetical protein PtrM4_137060 [Pyrenophora tritici-repentis]
MLAATVTANRCGIVNVEFECEKLTLGASLSVKVNG